MDSHSTPPVEPSSPVSWEGSEPPHPAVEHVRPVRTRPRPVPSAIWLAPLAVLGLLTLTVGHRTDPLAAAPAQSDALEGAWKEYRRGNSVAAHQLAENYLRVTEARSADSRAGDEARSLLALTGPRATPTPELTSPSPSPTPAPAAPVVTVSAPVPSATPRLVRPPAPLEVPATPSPVALTLPVPRATYPLGHPVARAPSEEEEEEEPIAPAPPSGLSQAALVRASRELRQTLERRDLQAIYVGTGLPGEVLELSVANRSTGSVRLHFPAGLRLQADLDPSVPPLLVSDDADLVVGPGETAKTHLKAYALDATALPGYGRMVDYHALVVPGSRPVRLIQAGRTFVFHPRIEAGLHRRAALQLALWRAAGFPIDAQRYAAALGTYARDRWARSAAMGDATDLLKVTKG